ncbi:MAG: hypothetical protein VKP72_13050 [bacterium]|nr:hypothetical protein [bacterium]
MTARTRALLALSWTLSGVALFSACTAEEGGNPLGTLGDGAGQLQGKVTATVAPSTTPPGQPTGKPGTDLPARVEDGPGASTTMPPGTPGAPIATPTPGITIAPGVDTSQPPSQLATLAPLPGGPTNGGTTPPTPAPVRALDGAPSAALPLEGAFRSPLTNLPVFWGGGQRWLLDATGMSWAGGEAGSWPAGTRAVAGPGTLWRATGDRLEQFELDPEAVVPQPTSPSRSWTLPGDVLALAADSSGAWAVLTGDRVWGWEASSNATRSVPVSGARDVLLSGTRVLVLDAAAAVPVSRSNGQVGANIALGGEPGPAFVDSAGTAWIARKGLAQIRRITADTTSATSVGVAAPVTCWAEAKNRIWAGEASAAQVQSIALDGTPGATISLPVAPDVAIADGAGQVWLAERASGHLARLIP